MKSCFLPESGGLDDVMRNVYNKNYSMSKILDFSLLRNELLVKAIFSVKLKDITGIF